MYWMAFLTIQTCIQILIGITNEGQLHLTYLCIVVGNL